MNDSEENQSPTPDWEGRVALGATLIGPVGIFARVLTHNPDFGHYITSERPLLGLMLAGMYVGGNILVDGIIRQRNLLRNSKK
jgi:hypothetical protein